MVADRAALCAAAVLSGGRVWQMPFHEGGAIDEWDVVEVDYLGSISRVADYRCISQLTRRRSSNFGCACVSSASHTIDTAVVLRGGSLGLVQP